MKNKFEIKERMRAGRLTSASFATVDSHGNIKTDPDLQLEASKDTVFQCASLSKPVFAYLVLKLIEANKEANKTKSTEKDWVGKFKTDYDLKTPLYKIFKDKGTILEGNNNPFLKQFSDQDQEQAKKLTAEMVLSHTTGLPIVGKEPYQFQFEPGKHYAYSGPGIECLQGAIEELTGTNLELLAQEHVFGKQALDMPHSTYGSEPLATHSLKTTAEEYVKFIKAWINDDKFNYAFNPVKPADSMMNDYFPNPKSVGRLVENINIEESDRNRVAWGLGIGLVKNDQGQIIGAYHTGDSGESGIEWRAGFGAVIDPESKRCIEASVYLTKSPNGHILAEQVLPEILKPALNYFFPTYGFARNAEELDGTNYHGMNPKLLNPVLREEAYKTKTTTFVGSDQSVENPSKILKSALKIVKSQEHEESKHIQDIERTKAEERQDERKFNPSPLSTTYDPNKQ